MEKKNEEKRNGNRGEEWEREMRGEQRDEDNMKTNVDLVSRNS